MEHTFTQEELREALLAALLDYEAVKKTRRMKAVKKTLQGTMMATLLGSTGLMAAGQGRTAPAREAAYVSAQSQVAVLDDFPQEAGHSRFIPGAAHFGFNQHALSASQEDRLLGLARELPRGAQVSIIGRTDASGGKRYNQKLGLQRAQAAADFLAAHGVNVKAIGSKISNHMPEDWMKRRVDIVVDTAQPYSAMAATPAPRMAAQPTTQHAPVITEPKYSHTPPAPAIVKPAAPKPAQADVFAGQRNAFEGAPKMPPRQDTADLGRKPPVGDDTFDSMPPQAPAQPVLREAASTVAAPVPVAPKPVARKQAAKPTVSNIAIADARPPVDAATKSSNRPILNAPIAALPEDNGTISTPATSTQPGMQRQVIRGVTHFATNSYDLAWAHKERLIELVKQLPKDAELTVVGRTESDGAEDANKDLGKLRAITVATFLTNFGVKVKAVGSKESSDRFTGWGARRVDIVVDSAPTRVKINMPQQGQEGTIKAGLHQDSQRHSLPPLPEAPTEPRSPYLYKVD